MIKIVNADKFIKDNKLSGPITTPQLYVGKTETYHPHGLYSEEIFGIDGSKERRESFSWVELNCHVINPAIYDSLSKRIFRGIDELLADKKRFIINDEGYLEESEDGDIYGMTAFYNNIHRIKFKKSEDESSERNKIIDMYYRNIKNNTFFMDKLLIISPDMRPPVVMGEEIKHDDLTQIYRKIVRQSNQVKGIGGLLYDSLTYNIQLELLNMFDFIKNKVSKKSGIIREQMLGKRVDFSGLAVITPNPNIPPGTAGIPLRMVVGLFEPNLIYGILNSDYADNIPQEFHDEVRKYLGHDVEDVSDEE